MIEKKRISSGQSELHHFLKEGQWRRDRRVTIYRAQEHYPLGWSVFQILTTSRAKKKKKIKTKALQNFFYTSATKCSLQALPDVKHIFFLAFTMMDALVSSPKKKLL